MVVKAMFYHFAKAVGEGHDLEDIAVMADVLVMSLGRFTIEGMITNLAKKDSILRRAIVEELLQALHRNHIYASTH